MTPEQYARAQQLFEAVQELPAARRAGRLLELCPDDAALRERVLALLDADPGRLPPLQSLVHDALCARAGDCIGPYRLVRLLGEGGMGEVWLAEQLEPIQRQVALKLIKPGMDSRRVIARFEAERRALGVMDHPAIARIYDAGFTTRGLPYFAMEYVDGRPITAFCDEQQLPVGERLELFTRVCAGVQHAHQRAILHRDLKPSNVLVRTIDGRPAPTIIDFGIAKALQEPPTERPLQTEFGTLVGTPEYMSPERLRGTELAPDTRADVYALGVILCELLVGALPHAPRETRTRHSGAAATAAFDQAPSTPSALLRSSADAETVARQRSTSAAALQAALRRDLDWIVAKALAPEIEQRYASAEDLAQDLARHLGSEPVSARPPSAAYLVSRFVQRHRLAVASGVAIAVLLGAGVTGTAVGFFKAREAEAEARRDAEIAEQSLAFLVNLFKSADPFSGGSPTRTSKQMLDAGVEQLRQDTHLDPAARGRLKQAIGYSYLAAFDVESAERLLKEALDEQRAAFGDMHPQTLRTEQFLAELYWTVGPLEEAALRARKAADGLRSTLGPDDPATLEADGMLLTVLLRQGEGQAVLGMAEDLLERRTRVLGADALPTAETIATIASLKLRAGEIDAAERMNQQALRIRRERLGADHVTTFQSETALADVAMARGDLAAAEATYRRGVALIEARWGATTKPAYRMHERLANVLSAASRWPEARDEYRIALDGYRTLLQPGHPDILTVAYQLGRTQAALGETAAATALLQESCDGRRAQFGMSHELTVAACTVLADLAASAR
jgi:non-specific serine/threonine protein kinase/serine/threonine-protein kinase